MLKVAGECVQVRQPRISLPSNRAPVPCAVLYLRFHAGFQWYDSDTGSAIVQSVGYCWLQSLLQNENQRERQLLFYKQKYLYGMPFSVRMPAGFLLPAE